MENNLIDLLDEGWRPFTNYVDGSGPYDDFVRVDGVEVIELAGYTGQCKLWGIVMSSFRDDFVPPTVIRHRTFETPQEAMALVDEVVPFGAGHLGPGVR